MGFNKRNWMMRKKRKREKRIKEEGMEGEYKMICKKKRNYIGRFIEKEV